MGRLCREVFVALVNQIKAWRTESSCDAGEEKCLYELVSARPLLITAKHTSRHRGSVEDLSFALRPTEQELACRVTAVDWLMLKVHQRGDLSGLLLRQLHRLLIVSSHLNVIKP
ncbi:hypothetical protein AOLI_G00115080 [Acnodon oligacanthus]